MTLAQQRRKLFFHPVRSSAPLSKPKRCFSAQCFVKFSGSPRSSQSRQKKQIMLDSIKQLKSAEVSKKTWERDEKKGVYFVKNDQQLFDKKIPTPKFSRNHSKMSNLEFKVKKSVTSSNQNVFDSVPQLLSTFQGFVLDLQNIISKFQAYFGEDKIGEEFLETSFIKRDLRILGQNLARKFKPLLSVSGDSKSFSSIQELIKNGKYKIKISEIEKDIEEEKRKCSCQETKRVFNSENDLLATSPCFASFGQPKTVKELFKPSLFSLLPTQESRIQGPEKQNHRIAFDYNS